MWKVTYHPRAIRKVHFTVLKKVCDQIVQKENQRPFKDYQKVVETGGSRVFIVYQFHEENIIYVKEARFAKKS